MMLKIAHALNKDAFLFTTYDNLNEVTDGGRHVLKEDGTLWTHDGGYVDIDGPAEQIYPHKAHYGHAVNNPGYGGWCRVLYAQRNGDEEMFIFSGPAYLMSDEGKTVERYIG